MSNFDAPKQLFISSIYSRETATYRKIASFPRNSTVQKSDIRAIRKLACNEAWLCGTIGTKQRGRRNRMRRRGTACAPHERTGGATLKFRHVGIVDEQIQEALNNWQTERMPEPIKEPIVHNDISWLTYRYNNYKWIILAAIWKLWFPYIKSCFKLMNCLINKRRSYLTVLIQITFYFYLLFETFFFLVLCTVQSRSSYIWVIISKAICAWRWHRTPCITVISPLPTS